MKFPKMRRSTLPILRERSMPIRAMARKSTKPPNSSQAGEKSPDARRRAPRHLEACIVSALVSWLRPSPRRATYVEGCRKLAPKRFELIDGLPGGIVPSASTERPRRIYEPRPAHDRPPWIPSCRRGRGRLATRGRAPRFRSAMSLKRQTPTLPNRSARGLDLSGSSFMSADKSHLREPPRKKRRYQTMVLLT